LKGPESTALVALRASETRDNGDPNPQSGPTACPLPRDGSPWGDAKATTDDLDDPLAGLRMPGLPVRRDPRLLKQLRWISESAQGRRFFAEALHRSGHYRPILAEALHEKNRPLGLLAVPLVESGYIPTATSPAGARGLWQLMPATGRIYGLIVSPELDERASLWRATDAALRHLDDLHDRFGSWDLALAAYNMGYEALVQRLDETGLADFWALADLPGALPRETAQYVPRVLAAALVMENLEEFGFAGVLPGTPIDAGEVEVRGGMSLAAVARAAGTSVRRLRQLNPELETSVLPYRDEPITLHVPVSGVARARAMLPHLSADAPDEARAAEMPADFDWGRDEVAPSRAHAGAARDALDIDEDRVAPWHRSHPAFGARAAVKRDALSRDDLAEQSRVYYRVVRGDTVGSIASTFGLHDDDVLAQAGLTKPTALREGTMIALRVSPGALARLAHKGAGTD
jgi:membrane-bound lytic murein transglycosylase D